MADQNFWQETVTVYLIHFDRPYRHAQHYLGSAVDLDNRIKEHESGNGSHLMEAVNRAKIDWKIVRTWEGVPRWIEAKLHHRHDNPSLCPFCNPNIAIQETGL